MPWTRFSKAQGRWIPFMVVQLYNRDEKEKTNIVSLSPPKGDQTGRGACHRRTREVPRSSRGR